MSSLHRNCQLGGVEASGVRIEPTQDEPRRRSGRGSCFLPPRTSLGSPQFSIQRCAPSCQARPYTASVAHIPHPRVHQMASSTMNPGIGTLISTFSGALQGTVSVLLTLLAGYIMARRGFLDHKTVRNVSKLCTSLFLPCLIVESMGPQLTASNLRAVWIIPLWGLFSTILAHAVGWLGQRVFKLPYWTIAASGRPNSNALPLLLLQSLESTGVLDTLSRPGEDVSATLARAKSLILLNAIVQQTITFQFTPSIIERDSDHSKDNDPESQDRLRPGPGQLTTVVQDQERVGLLDDYEHGSGDPGAEGYSGALNDIADQPDVHWPHRIRFLEKPLKTIWAGMSPPLIGAILALVIGVSLRRACSRTKYTDSRE